MSEHIRPDTFSKIVTAMGEFAVNAKYDRIDYFPRFGAYIIKVYDDEGLQGWHVSEEEAVKVFQHTDLPVCERDFMYESEYENYLIAKAQMLDDEMYGGFDEVEE